MFKAKMLEHHFLNHRIVIKAICDNHNIPNGPYDMALDIHISFSMNRLIRKSHNR